MAGLHRKEKASSLRAPSVICRTKGRRALSVMYLSRSPSLKYKPEEGTKGPLEGLDISFEAVNTKADLASAQERRSSTRVHLDMV